MNKDGMTVSYDPFAGFDAEIQRFLVSTGLARDEIELLTPPNVEFGERATNVAFQLAKKRRQAPRQIAMDIAGQFEPETYTFLRAVEPAGAGFINFRLNYNTFVPHAILQIREAADSFGRRPDAPSRRVIVEHTSVNPNKEWHIGHVRNAILGDVLARILRLRGDTVEVQNYIDDTGLQAAQAVLGFEDYPEEPKPDEKYDHYVGRSYVKVAAELGSERELRDRLRELEVGPDVARDETSVSETESILARLENIERLKGRVMAKMRALEDGEYYPLITAILDAQLQTAYRLGVYYDLLNWESHLVTTHTFDDAMERLRQSPMVSRPTEGRYQGALIIQTGPPAQDGEESQAEVLIRSSGLPTYVAKDIAYHIWKFGLLPDHLRYQQFAEQPNGATLWSTAVHGQPRSGPRPDSVVNVIGVNQSLAQDAVKAGLRAGGFPEAADQLVHLAYGLVSTAEGKISGRKGTSVSGDAVIDQAVEAAYDRVREKRSQDLTETQMREIAEAVGIGALRYFMVQYNPLRDIVFDAADVVSYDGNTGLYIQYALVRMFAILRKAQEFGVSDTDIDGGQTSLLLHDQEKRLVHAMTQYPAVITDAGRTLSVNLVAEFAFDLATIFSQFYRDCSVLNAEPQTLRNARLLLVRTVRDVLSNACGVLGVPVIERL